MADWVSELKNCTCKISIFQAEYNGETVFWQLMNDPLCQGVIANIPVFNCLGEKILVLEDFESWTNFTSKVSEIKIIYSCTKP